MIAEYLAEWDLFFTDCKLTSLKTGLKCMHESCDDFSIQVITLIIYYAGAASSIFSHLLDHGFIAVISNSKRVDTNIVLFMFGSLDNNIYIVFFTISEQEDTCLRRILW